MKDTTNVTICVHWVIHYENNTESRTRQTYQFLTLCPHQQPSQHLPAYTERCQIQLQTWAVEFNKLHLPQYIESMTQHNIVHILGLTSPRDPFTELQISTRKTFVIQLVVCIKAFIRYSREKISGVSRFRHF